MELAKDMMKLFTSPLPIRADGLNYYEGTQKYAQKELDENRILVELPGPVRCLVRRQRRTETEIFGDLSWKTSMKDLRG